MRTKNLFASPILLLVLFFFSNTQAIQAASVDLASQTAGQTPFISFLTGSVTPAQALKSVQFTIAPKPGSVTRAISATYTSAYLIERGYLNSETGAISIPIFGLYAGYTNTVTLLYTFTDNTTQQVSTQVVTSVWTDPCNEFTSPIVLQPRTSSTALSYDFFLIKNDCGNESPTIMDSDGTVRWVGTAHFTSHASMFFDNGIYISAPPPHSSSHTGLARMEFDGTYTFLQDYSPLNVTDTGHHNFDRGKAGMVLEVNTTTQTESVLMEVDALGTPLKSWNLADIISGVMTAGGDDPSQFVAPAPHDWFHNNASTYRASDDSLIVSSRENFVIGLDYGTGAIKWILGDPNKQWHQFASLRAFALNLGQSTLPPIGQHGVSFTKDDDLLLFDDGQNSMSHTPPGTDRQSSFPRKYALDLQNRDATEVWNYSTGNTLFSWICSSVYEDAALNYLIDYADIINVNPPTQYAELIGLEASGAKVFDYRYTTSACSTAWNSIPLHLEAMNFATVVPDSVVSRKVHGTAGTFDVPLPLAGNPGIECRSGGTAGDYEVVFIFPSPVTAPTATVASSTEQSPGTVHVVGSPTIEGNQVTVEISGAQPSDSLVVTLNGVSDGTNVSMVSAPMRVLVGDITGDGAVTKADLKLDQGKKSKSVNSSNFRRDVNVDGKINKSDAAEVKANLATPIRHRH